MKILVAWTPQSYDLSQYAGTKVRIAIHVKTANQQYASLII